MTDADKIMLVELELDGTLDLNEMREEVRAGGDGIFYALDHLIDAGIPADVAKRFLLGDEL